MSDALEELEQLKLEPSDIKSAQDLERLERAIERFEAVLWEAERLYPAGTEDL